MPSGDEDNDHTPEKTKEKVEEPDSPRRLKHVFLRLPCDRGITGIAMKTGEIQVVPKGAYDVLYAAEVDNSIASPVINNLMIGPLFDTTGRLRGVIQLINKTGSDPISFQDEREFKKLLPTVAEIIK